MIKYFDKTYSWNNRIEIEYNTWIRPYEMKFIIYQELLSIVYIMEDMFEWISQ